LESEPDMAISVDSIDNTQYIRLTEAIDIAQAAELKRILMDAIASSSRIRIPVSGATVIDVTVVQLLWASILHASSAGTDLVVEGPWSKEVERLFECTGIPILNSVAPQTEREATSVLASRH
jgi:anti-anti-sigma factor